MNGPEQFPAGVAPRAYLTHDIPGIAGRLRERPEDFIVDEIPLSNPAGSGEHIHLLVQKRDMSTLDMVGVIARHFRVPRTAVGFAGLKDKRAVARQVVSVHAPGKKPEDFPSLDHPSIEIQWADLHTSKLRRGHLEGNRFSIRIRGVRPTDALHARRVLQTLVRSGVPNRFGEQRFGFLGNNHAVGACLAKGDAAGAARQMLGVTGWRPEAHAQARELFEEGRFQEAMALYPPKARAERLVLLKLSKGQDPARALRAVDPDTRSFYFSAFQSAVFNAVLDARIASGRLAALVPGDIAARHAERGVFRVDPATAADPATLDRLARVEISATGPMWSARLMRAEGEIDASEVGALNAAGLTIDDLERFEQTSDFRPEGERRAFRAPIREPDVEGGVDEHGPYVRVGFILPRGSFATVALREIMKPAPTETLEEPAPERGDPTLA